MKHAFEYPLKKKNKSIFAIAILASSLLIFSVCELIEVLGRTT